MAGKSAPGSSRSWRLGRVAQAGVGGNAQPHTEEALHTRMPSVRRAQQPLAQSLFCAQSARHVQFEPAQAQAEEIPVALSGTQSASRPHASLTRA